MKIIIFLLLFGATSFQRKLESSVLDALDPDFRRDDEERGKETMHPAVHLFTRLGLREGEATIYLACLREPSGLYIHEITAQTGINRSTVDVMVDRMLAEGYLTRVKTGARFQYRATPSTIILQRQEALIDDFKAAIPLLARLSSNTQDTDVRFFEGAKGVQQIYEIVLNELKISEGAERELLNIAAGGDVLKTYTTIDKEFIKPRIKARIPIRLIVPDSMQSAPAYDNDPKALRTARYFDGARYPFHIDMGVAGQCVYIYSPRAPIGGMVMKNDKIAQSMRSLFNMIWDMLPA